MADEINRKLAQSEKVSYSDPVELHDTRDLRIEFIPFYIKRTLGTQMRCKIIRTDKQNDYQKISINLNSTALNRLHDAIKQHLAVSDEDDGSYLLIQTDGMVHGKEGITVQQAAKAIEELLKTNGVIFELSGLNLSSEIIHALKVELRLRELRQSVADLSGHLREGLAEERVYQEWCENNSWSFGNAYVVNDQLRAISASDKVDLLLPRNLGGFRDLIEVKRPDIQIILWDKSHKSWYFSADVSRAIGQCHRYLDVLHQEVGLSGLRDTPEVLAYHPRATVVVGRTSEWTEEQYRALHGLNSRFTDISVISYDHLLAQARRTLELVESDALEEEVIVPTVTDWYEDDDEPF